MSKEVWVEYPEHVDDISRRQYASIGWLSLRWNLYRLARSPIDFYESAYERLSLQGDEALLDIGCADGSGLYNLRSEHNHSGRLVGLDIDQQFFSNTEDKIKNQSLQELEFAVGSAQKLPFADDSMDVSMAMFMLYHVPQPEVALSEMQRVTKKDGRIVIATSGQENKPKHRQFEADIADYLGIEKPPIFAEPFNYTIATRLLPQKFEIMEHFAHKDEMEISEEDYEVYADSLLSMKDSFVPPPSAKEFTDAIEHVVNPVIMQEIEENGCFHDNVDRHLFVCRNKK